ncbi:thymidylate synthase [Kosmotoga arenicorallina S304]|uniref:Flavin-dependent thymidylate synthase n=1 Tax=Kosmotoga arenicorallina S304 TaxID=1453497 RepID=A0A182C822_9BACT|nr:thymidylate synthase [Kosmotoga arenicorallina S304]
MEIRVLDKGFVRLVEVFGDDFSAVQAARVSYGKGLTTTERDRKLIYYLMEHGHHSPFEHIIMKFHIKLPIFVMRQLVRHRIASINERSGRYTEFKEDWYVPDHIRTPDSKNKQGSVITSNEKLTGEAIDLIEMAIEKSFEAYNRLLEMGVARELARIVLPTSMYTECYWTINIRSLMNFLNLRADSHAQWEMQQYALAIAEIFERCCPLTYEAFLKYGYTGDLLKLQER